MSKMTVIQLLNKIANGEEVPKIIKYKNVIWYFNKKYKTYFMNNTEIELFYIEKITERLNDEIEIIEEPQEHKIPEKLDIVLLDQSDNWTRKYNKNLKDFESAHIELNPYVIDVIRQNTLEFQSKINEIIDYLEVNKDE